MTPSPAIQKILAALKANHEEAVRLRLELEKHFSEAKSDRPVGFDDRSAAKVLRGEMDKLDMAFAWMNTPQGHDFWSKQVRAGVLSPEGRDILEKWLAE